MMGLGNQWCLANAVPGSGNTVELNRQEACLLGAYRLMGEMTSLPNNVTVTAVLSSVYATRQTWESTLSRSEMTPFSG